MPPVWKSEAGETALASRQHLLYTTICNGGRSEMPIDDALGRGPGNASGLEDRQGDGGVVHEATVRGGEGDLTGGDWNRRDLDSERAHVSYCRQRFSASSAHLVWRRGSFGGEYESVLCLAG